MILFFLFRRQGLVPSLSPLLSSRLICCLFPYLWKSGYDLLVEGGPLEGSAPFRVSHTERDGAQNREIEKVRYGTEMMRVEPQYNSHSLQLTTPMPPPSLFRLSQPEQLEQVQLTGRTDGRTESLDWTLFTRMEL